ncbi:MAG: class I SAM-dependent methyltransferase [Bryobacteraceae bacterium]|nr:class I SAM-dependent methyltransferase [Bryobacteraceae bacterium]
MSRVHSFLDDPPNARFGLLPLVRGWCAQEDFEWNGAVLRGPDGPVAFHRVPRPDVERLLPGHSVLGFSATMEREVAAHDSFDLVIETRGAEQARWRVIVPPEAREARDAMRRARADKQAWCRQRLRCPMCRHPDLRDAGAALECPRCSTSFPQTTGALNLLTPELYRQCALEETENISANGYDPQVYSMIQEAEAAGGMILDCGSGYRPEVQTRVVNLEIVDYPSTDVLAVGQSVPFHDGVFDAVFSFAVLEHVSDPFACARELVRVLKPGGRLYCHVPFLQPEHGYPSHFYNMTRQGLRNLFPDMRMERHEVPPSGYPMHSLHWFISQYAAHLPPASRDAFLAMRMGDVLSRGPFDWNSEPVVFELGEAGRWILASTTAILLRKA